MQVFARSVGLWSAEPTRDNQLHATSTQSNDRVRVALTPHPELLSRRARMLLGGLVWRAVE